MAGLLHLQKAKSELQAGYKGPQIFFVFFSAGVKLSLQRYLSFERNTPYVWKPIHVT